MAVDTRDKRMSIMSAGTIHPEVAPDPDSAIEEGDRRHRLHLYRFHWVEGGGMEDFPLSGWGWSTAAQG